MINVRKQLFKIAALILMLFVITVPLVACQNAITGDEARKTANEFFELLGNEDYDGIAALMHPSLEVTGESIATYFSDVEIDHSLDFGKGVTDVRYTGFYTSVSTDGGKYELSGSAECGGVSFDFEINVFKTKDGAYGISYIQIS